MSTRVNESGVTEYEGQDGNWYPVQNRSRIKPTVGMSADRRRTEMRQVLIARGIHPTTKLRLLHAEWSRSCGDCDHHRAFDYHGRIYHKCDKVEMTHGPGTDVRVSWPACTAFRESA